MNDTGAVVRTCEAHIFVNGVNISADFTYDTCVQDFQSITETCMLLDPKGKYAESGKQAGVMRALYSEGGTNGPIYTTEIVGGNETEVLSYPPGAQPAGTGTAPNWMLAMQDNPGYMVGPPGYFGSVFGCDATAMLRTGTCW